MRIRTLAGDDPARYLSYDAASMADLSDRLSIRAVTEDDAELLVELMQRVNEGNLDVGMMRDVDAHGPEAAAREYLDDMTALDPSRTHWLLGYDADQPVAIAIGLQVASTGATEIRADTDYTNAPMVRTFERAGWVSWGTRVVLQGPPRTM